MTIQGVASDFDFFLGDWRVSHRRLKARLAACQEWEEFGGSCSVRSILGGLGNIDDNVVELPTGAYRAITLRSFDTRTRRWAIWWLDGRAPHSLDVPMIGEFEGGVGSFFADDTFEGRPIRVRFLWTQTQTGSPRWEQAFADRDSGEWETNWLMQFTRCSDAAAQMARH